MKLSGHISALALAGLMGAATPLAVVAQAQQSTPSAEAVSSEEVEAFVVAYQSVQAVNEEYNAQVAEATDDAELQALQEEAQAKSTEAVEETPGIDMDRYVEILILAEADPELSAQIVEKLSE